MTRLPVATETALRMLEPLNPGVVGSPFMTGNVSEANSAALLAYIGFVDRKDADRPLVAGTHPPLRQTAATATIEGQQY